MFSVQDISKYYPFVFIITTLCAATSSGLIPQAFLILTFLFSGYCVLSIYYRNRELGHVLTRTLVATCLSSVVYLGCIFLGNEVIDDPLDIRLLEILIKYLFGPSVFLLAYLMDWHYKANRERLLNILIFVNLLLLLIRFYTGINTDFVIGDIHSNYLGAFAAISLGITILTGYDSGQRLKQVRILILISLTLTVLSLSRGAYAGLIAGCAAYFIVGKYNKSILLSLLISLTAVIFIIISTFNYSSWLNSDESAFVRDIVEDVTSKPLDTGRAKYWTSAIEQINENPWLGSGFDSRESWDRKLKDGEIITLSTHNYYLAILNEAGIFGLLSVIVLLFTILSTLISDSRYSIINSSIFLGILVHQSTEIALTTGNYALGGLMWFTWGIGARLASSSNQEIPHY